MSCTRLHEHLRCIWCQWYQMCLKKVIEKKQNHTSSVSLEKHCLMSQIMKTTKRPPTVFLCITALSMEYYVVMVGSAAQRSGIQATGPQKYGVQALVTEEDIKTWSVARFEDNCDCLSIYINRISIPDKLLPVRSRVGFIRHRPQMIYPFGLRWKRLRLRTYRNPKSGWLSLPVEEHLAIVSNLLTFSFQSLTNLASRRGTPPNWAYALVLSFLRHSRPTTGGQLPLKLARALLTCWCTDTTYDWGGWEDWQQCRGMEQG